MNRKVLVVAAHPDDEVLGCGATIIKYVKRGFEVHVVILAEGITSRDLQRDPVKRNEDLIALTTMAEKANELMGVSGLTFHSFPDNRMDSIVLLDIVKPVEEIIRQLKPEIVLTHYGGDLNIDHQMVNQVVVTASRPVPGCSVKTLLFFEVLSSTEWNMSGLNMSFIPNWFEDVSEYLNLKLEALKAYHGELRAWPHPRSVEAAEYLMRYRGSNIGVSAAEAFVLGRNIHG